MSVMAMAAHTGCNTVYGSTPPNNPHPYPWMNSLFQDGITVGWLLGESFIVDHGRRSVIPERLADALMNRDKDVINPREYYEYLHFSDAVMTDQEILELPKAWVVGGDGGMGDIGYQNTSKVILQNRPNVKALMLDTRSFDTAARIQTRRRCSVATTLTCSARPPRARTREEDGGGKTFLAGHGSTFIGRFRSLTRQSCTRRSSRLDNGALRSSNAHDLPAGARRRSDMALTRPAGSGFARRAGVLFNPNGGKRTGGST